MSTDRSDRRSKAKTVGWLLHLSATLLICLFVLVLLYFGAFIAMGTRSINPAFDAQIYEHEWQAGFFAPAAKFESAVRGKRVETGYVLPPENQP